MGLCAGLEDAGGFGVLGVEFGDLDFFGEADFFEQPDAVVVDVELVPGEAVACADGVGVVVVVPAFAAGEERDPPGVAGVVFGLEAARADEVGGGVDQPGGVQADDDAEEGSPEHHGEAADDGVAGGCESCADGDLQQAADGEREPVVLREPDVALVAGEVGDVAAEQGGLGVEGAAGDDPAHVRPPGAVLRGVGVAFLVGVLMMDAVGGDPEDRSAFEGERAAGGEEVLEPCGHAVAAVGEQAVIAMPMPTLMARKYMMQKAARFFQEKKKSAARAPTWKRPMAMVVIQLTWPCWCSRPMRRSCLTFCATLVARRRAASMLSGVAGAVRGVAWIASASGVRSVGVMSVILAS